MRSRALVPVASLLGFAALGLPASVRAADPLVPVSPGSSSGRLELADPCPTFSWSSSASSDENRSELELRVHTGGGAPERRSEDTVQEDRVPENTVLLVRLPGGARSFTPSLGECLGAGAAYEWSIRRVDESPAEEGPAGAREEILWHRFATSPSPSRASIAELLRQAAAPLGQVEARASRADEPGERLTRLAAGGLTSVPPLVRISGPLAADRLATVFSAQTLGAIRIEGSAPSVVGRELAVERLRFNDGADGDPGDGSDAEVDVTSDGFPPLMIIGRPGNVATAGLADLATGTVVAGRVIVEGPIDTERSGFVGSGGTGFFRALVDGLLDADRTVDIDDNEQLCEICAASGCRSAVVVGARLFPAGGDQIGLQVLCGEPR